MDRIILEQHGDGNVQIAQNHAPIHIYAGDNKIPIQKINQVSLWAEKFTTADGNGVSLQNAYIPNSYTISVSSKRDDLLKFVDSFINEKLIAYSSFIPDKDYDAKTLIVRGYQGIGKSSLLAKIAHDFSNEMLWSEKKAVFTSFKKICEDKFDIKMLLGDVGETLPPVLFVDALDESNLTEAEAVNRLNDLIDDLHSYNGKIITTCRRNFVNASDVRSAIEITLQPFTIDLFGNYAIRSKL